MTEKKIYASPELESCILDEDDIITASPNTSDGADNDFEDF